MKFFLTAVATLALLSSASQPTPQLIPKKSRVEASTDKEAPSPVSTLSSMGSVQYKTQKDSVKVNPFVVGEYKAHPSDYITDHPILMSPKFWQIVVQIITKGKRVSREWLLSSYLKLTSSRLLSGKVSEFALCPQNQGKQDLEEEYDALKRLNHPNIVRCYGIHNNEEKSTISMVMKGNSYGSIEKLFEKKSPMLTVTLLKKFLLEVHTAMKYMHTVGIVHRDIKLENLIIWRTA